MDSLSEHQARLKRSVEIATQIATETLKKTPGVSEVSVTYDGITIKLKKAEEQPK